MSAGNNGNNWDMSLVLPPAHLRNGLDMDQSISFAIYPINLLPTQNIRVMVPSMEVKLVKTSSKNPIVCLDDARRQGKAFDLASLVYVMRGNDDFAIGTLMGDKTKPKVAWPVPSISVLTSKGMEVIPCKFLWAVHPCEGLRGRRIAILKSFYYSHHDYLCLIFEKIYGVNFLWIDSEAELSAVRGIARIHKIHKLKTILRKAIEKESRDAKEA